MAFSSSTVWYMSQSALIYRTHKKAGTKDKRELRYNGPDKILGSHNCLGSF